ncbi:arginine/serine-rich protein PNISR-like [Helianthus annuus]|uniref:arginine/serine-rich protein PNISR-like n=1 Tax=Helianthus annuus TaxID=4232 RepID=UPI000B8F327C|nr:arginine/serine-rich protein PNISR-like [Helianthus annuus]
MRSKRRSVDKSHKKAKKKKEEKKIEKTKEKPKDQKVKLSQGQKDRLRKKRNKVREYLKKILSSDTIDESDNSSEDSFYSTKSDPSSKRQSSVLTPGSGEFDGASVPKRRVRCVYYD